MKLQNLFKINILFALFFGISCVFFPRFTFWLYQVVPDEAAIWVTRLAGGSILGFATLMWFGINSASVSVRKAIAYAILVQDTIGCIASIEFQFIGDVNAFGWLSLTLYGCLALAYAYFLFIVPNKC